MEVVSGVIQTSEGLRGPAFDFDGLASFVQVEDTLLNRFDLGNKFSFSCYIYPKSYSNNVLPRIWEKRSIYLSFMGDSGNGKYRRLAIEVQNSTGAGNANAGASEFWGSTLLETGVWYHVGGTFDGDAVGAEPDVYQGHIYVNGKHETMDNIFAWPTGADSHLQTTSGFDLFIGRRRTDQLRNFLGKISYLALYDRVIPDSHFSTLAKMAGL